MKPTRVYVRGIGASLPAHVVPNETLAKVTGIDPAWLLERTGIEARFLSNRSEKTSTLAAAAAREAFQSAVLGPDDIDLLVLATSFPDSFLPLSTAGVVKDRLQLKRAMALDISTPAIGFLLALQLAARYLGQGGFETALVVGAECFSAMGDLRDRRTCYLFGDGAGAMVLSASRGFATLSTPVVESLGPNGDSGPAGHELPVPDEHSYALALYNQPEDRLREGLERSLGRLMAQEGMRTQDLKFILPQQMHADAVKKAAATLNFPEGALYDDLLRTGNMLSATLPISLYHLLGSHRAARGDSVALVGTDGRFLWGSALVSVTGEVPAGSRETLFGVPGADEPGEVLAGRTRLPGDNFREAAELEEVVNEELRKADIFGSALSTLFFNVDPTDGVARSTEEQMSRETRLLFSRQVRRRDIVVQFGLGRFAVILPNQDASDAQRIAERLKRLLEKLDPAEEIEIVAAYETLTFHPGDRIDDYVGQVLRRSAG
jgi:3-oxoacyl-[acyl-carrier-protein] synthase-3